MTAFGEECLEIQEKARKENIAKNESTNNNKK
jgi:hypothetical protein